MCVIWKGNFGSSKNPAPSIKMSLWSDAPSPRQVCCSFLSIVSLFFGTIEGMRVFFLFVSEWVALCFLYRFPGYAFWSSVTFYLKPPFHFFTSSCCFALCCGPASFLSLLTDLPSFFPDVTTPLSPNAFPPLLIQTCLVSRDLPLLLSSTFMIYV